jgi:hypothetical protein
MSFLCIDYHDIEVDLGGVFLRNHWTYVSDCPRFVNEPSPFTAVPQQSAWTPVNRDVPDRWLATLFEFALWPKQRIDIR